MCRGDPAQAGAGRNQSGSQIGELGWRKTPFREAVRSRPTAGDPGPRTPGLAARPLPPSARPRLAPRRHSLSHSSRCFLFLPRLPLLCPAGPATGRNSWPVRLLPAWPPRPRLRRGEPPELPPRGWARHRGYGLRNAPRSFPTACLHGDAFFPPRGWWGGTSCCSPSGDGSRADGHFGLGFPQELEAWALSTAATTATGRSLPRCAHHPGCPGVPTALVLLYHATPEHGKDPPWQCPPKKAP